MSKTIQQTFTAALDALVEEIKKDRAILAVVLCGSLSHDTVWAKSDIDLVLVTIDDRKVENAGISLNADGVNVHAVLMPRGEFRQVVEGSVNNSFFHSFLAKGRLLYTTDPSIEDLCARLHTIGQRDTQLELVRAGTSALPPVDKAHKWFVTRGDLDYSALWILYAATPLALNPDFFRKVYTSLLNARKTKKNVEAALDAVDAYLAERAPSLFSLVLEYLPKRETSVRAARSKRTSRATTMLAAW
jgi:uncharacterized protein